MTAPAQRTARPRRGRLRGLGLTFVLSLVVFALAGAAGFAFAHEPQPDELRLAVDRSPEQRSDIVVAGSVESIEGNVLRLRTEEGLRDLTLPDDVAVEELAPADADALERGQQVVVGAALDAGGLVVTGIVALEDAR